MKARKRASRTRRRPSSLSIVIATGVVLCICGLIALNFRGALTMKDLKLTSFIAGSKENLFAGDRVALPDLSVDNISLTTGSHEKTIVEEDEEERLRRELVGAVSESPVRVKWDSLFDREKDLGVRVPGDIGKLKQAQILPYLEALVKQYMAPFKAGIWRRGFLEVLERRVLKDMPKLAAKGTATVLFQIKNKRVYMLDPHDVTHVPEKGFYRDRLNEIVWIISKLTLKGRIADTEFLVSVHDCVQTASMTHAYRGPKHYESRPVFTIVGCNFSDNIPIPLWPSNIENGGGYSSWDDTVSIYITDPTPWEDKKQKGVFRGKERLSMFYETNELAERNCDKVGRGRLFFTGRRNPDLMDVGVSGSCGSHTFDAKPQRAEDQHNFRYAISAEGNCFWADQLPLLLFGPSTVLKQETPCGMYFEPLLTPWSHYVPVDYYFNDLADRINWLRYNDKEAVKIVQQANMFAWNFLTLEAIEMYYEVLFGQYTKLLVEKRIVLDPAAVDVTEKRFVD